MQRTKLQANLRGFVRWGSALALIFLPINSFADAKADAEAKPKLIKVVPEGAYANQTDYEYPLYHITVVGENLPTGGALKIFLNDRQLKVRPVESDELPPRKQAPNAKLSDETKRQNMPDAYILDTGDGSQFELWINRLAYSGFVHLKVGRAISATPSSTPAVTPASQPNPPPLPNAVSGASPATSGSPTPGAPPAMPRVVKSNELPIALAEVEAGLPRNLFRIGAMLVALVVLAVPVFLVKKSQGYYSSGQTGGVLAALFLDKETATYSLSKLQFYLWTAVAVMGYVYLAASRSLVQGVWEFIDIPKNLPAIVFISASTGALAQVVTTYRGPKGAGEEHPSLADFVSSGGIVVAERVQFFIWTIIGTVVFVWLFITQDPVSIRDLPEVPTGFLELMGISSLGYLSGKFARRPGPVIDDIASVTIKSEPTLPQNPPAAGASGKPATAAASANEPERSALILRGRILSPDADFKITYQTKNETGGIQETVVVLTGAMAPEKVEVLEVDEQSKPDRTAKRLRILMRPNQEPTWLRGATKFTISNPDGQSASWAFPPAPEITSIEAQKEDAKLKITVKGKYLAPQATFAIGTKKLTQAQLPADAIEADVDESGIPPRYATMMELTVSTPEAGWLTGKHKLQIINPDGQVADGPFQVTETTIKSAQTPPTQTPPTQTPPTQTPPTQTPPAQTPPPQTPPTQTPPTQTPPTQTPPAEPPQGQP